MPRRGFQTSKLVLFVENLHIKTELFSYNIKKVINIPGQGTGFDSDIICLQMQTKDKTFNNQCYFRPSEEEIASVVLILFNVCFLHKQNNPLIFAQSLTTIKNYSIMLHFIRIGLMMIFLTTP